MGIRGGETTSDTKTGAATIMTMPGTLCGLDVLPGASNDFTVTLYDSEDSTTSGRLVIAVGKAVSGANADHNHDINVVCNRGIRAEVAGTAGSYVVRFRLG